MRNGWRPEFLVEREWMMEFEAELKQNSIIKESCVTVPRLCILTALKVALGKIDSLISFD